jgi:hypothetical protein
MADQEQKIANPNEMIKKTLTQIFQRLSVFENLQVGQKIWINIDPKTQVAEFTVPLKETNFLETLMNNFMRSFGGQTREQCFAFLDTDVRFLITVWDYLSVELKNTMISSCANAVAGLKNLDETYRYLPKRTDEIYNYYPIVGKIINMISYFALPESQKTISCIDAMAIAYRMEWWDVREEQRRINREREMLGLE